MTKDGPTSCGAGHSPTWCPGCGNFGIDLALKQALADNGAKTHDTVIVGGIGCGANLPYWSKAYGVNSLHGRPIPVATGIALANPGLTTVVIAGDGDTYGIGIGHFLHAMRRDPNITCIVCDNGVYGLTKGQASPTASLGFRGPSTPDGVIHPPVDPIALAVAMDCGFVARGYAGNVPHLRGLLTRAIAHKGFSLIDVVQPCVTYNKTNGYAQWSSRIQDVQAAGHDPANREAALRLALSDDGMMPIGVIYVKTPSLAELPDTHFDRYGAIPRQIDKLLESLSL